MHFFQVTPFWNGMNVKNNELFKKYRLYFGAEEKELNNKTDAAQTLLNIATTIQDKLYNRIKSENTYGLLLKLYYIFDEVHSIYLTEKSARTKLVELNIDDQSIVEEFGINRNIERDIIDATNIWIENCILLQHDVDISSINIKKEFVLDTDLLIDLYLYGFVSRGISLLNLSNKIGSNSLFYGLKITPNKQIPGEILKEHPYIYYNTSIIGNQNYLVESEAIANANDSNFGKGFCEEHGLDFLQFLAAIQCFQKDQLRSDDKSLTVVSKRIFIDLVEQYTIPSIDGTSFYNSFVLKKEDIKKHLRKNESIIWIVGSNKYRHEIRPFLELDDNNVLIAYGALEQSKQLWCSYYYNGGMCYTNPSTPDNMTQAMELRNKELSELLLNKIRAILNKHYTATTDLIDVEYYRIFGEKSINYGDYDIVFYSETSKELFLIESKYFSDSLNSSGVINDYEKMFEPNGYYSHCRSRCDLVLSEPDKIKEFLNATGEITVHLLFISSKPIEMEFTDKDGVVNMMSLNIFEKYIEGKLINSEDDSIVRSSKKI